MYEKFAVSVERICNSKYANANGVYETRKYVSLSCPHCDSTFADIPAERVKTNKASACKAHLASCPVHNAKPTGEATPTPAATTAIVSSVENGIAAELKLLREAREADRIKHEELEAKHEEERQAAKRRHDELMAELTGTRSQLTDVQGQLTGTEAQLTDVQAQLSDKRQCLTDVREWGRLKEPDNTLVPQLTCREMQLVDPLKNEIRLLQQQVVLLSEEAPASLVQRAAEAEGRARKLERENFDLAAKFRQMRDLANQRSKTVTRHKLPPKLLAESEHARKYSLIAFHPDKQPNEFSKQLAAALFKQASAAVPERSTGTAS